MNSMTNPDIQYDGIENGNKLVLWHPIIHGEIPSDQKELAVIQENPCITIKVSYSFTLYFEPCFS